MKKLTHVPRSSALAPHVRADEHPAAVYLASLSPDSRPSMQSGLDVCAATVKAGSNRETFPWAMLRAAHTKALRAQLVDRYAPRSVNRMLSAVRGVLKAAWELGQVTTDDYMRAIQIKHMSTKSLPPAGRYVEEYEVQKLLTAAASQREPLAFRDQALVVMLYCGGLRRQEASALDVADYDAATGELRVLRGKGRKYRDLAIAAGYRSWLEPWIDYQRSRRCEPLFVSWTRFGTPTSRRLGRVGIDHALNRVRELAGVKDFSPHDLRRSFATSLLDNGVDVLVVQDLMGHANLATTKIYDRRGAKTRRAAVEQLPVVLRYEDYLKNRRP